MATQAQINATLGDGPDSLFLQLYCEIADATPLDRPFTVSELLGHLPSIQRYGSGYQRDIILTMLARMLELDPPADGLRRAGYGEYAWRLAPKEDDADAPHEPQPA